MTPGAEAAGGDATEGESAGWESSAGEWAAEAHRLLSDRGWTVAVAESLTGGLLAATLVDIPGASTTFRGGFVVYATELKSTLADVPAGLLAANGPVDPDVARWLAAGARARCGADWGVATTGVAGPGPSDGIAAGTVWIGLASPIASRASVGGDEPPLGTTAKLVTLSGDRRTVRRAAVRAALAMLVEALRA